MTKAPDDLVKRKFATTLDEVLYLRSENERLRSQLVAAEEWKRNQQINWPMEIERRNKELAAAETQLQAMRKALEDISNLCAGARHLSTAIARKALRSLIEGKTNAK